MAEALAHLVDSLEELSLTQEEYPPNTEMHGKGEPIGSLVAFYKLRKVEASAHILLGKPTEYLELTAEYQLMQPLYPDAHFAPFFELFPPSLEYLTIAHCEIHVLEVLGELVIRVSLPHLRRIYPRFSMRAIIEYFASNLEVVKELAAEKGIILN